MTERAIAYYIRCKRPACAVVIEPSERVRGVLEEERYERVDRSAFEVHARVYAGVELPEVVGR